MANLTRVTWNAGWNPSQDKNGNPDALLRMDNLQQEAEGSISLVRGFNQIGGDFPVPVSDIFTKTVANTERLYIGLEQGYIVQRSNMDLSSPVILIDQGGSRPVFGTSLGQVYAASGTKRVKDDGTTIRPLGIPTPTDTPVISEVTQGLLNFNVGEGEVIEGSIDPEFPTSNEFYVSRATRRAIVKWNLGSVNTFNISGGLPSSDPSGDKFYCLVRFHDSAEARQFRVELRMDDNNYYYREFDVTQLNPGIEVNDGPFTQFGCRRDEFTRQGSDTNLDWTQISEIRVIAVTSKVPPNPILSPPPTPTPGPKNGRFLTGEFRFVGGSEGQLTGLYVYRYVNVYNNGVYVGTSAGSPTSDPVLVINGKLKITTVIDPGANSVRVFRKSLPSSDFRLDAIGKTTGEVIQPALNDFFETVLDSDGFDTFSDAQVLELNNPLNQFLQSVLDITESFIGFEGLINEKMLYLTDSACYLSDRLNPDVIDLRFTIKSSGDPSERNLWIKQVSEGLMVLATTKDLYTIKGTLLDQPDGTIDIDIKGLGEKYPPICIDFAFTSINGIGTIFYIAADGWRTTTGSNSGNISPQLDKLFQKQERYGLAPIQIFAPGTGRYDITVGRNKLYCVSQHTDGKRYLFIFDFLRKVWRIQYTDPIALCTTESDRLFWGYGGGSGNNILEAEYGETGAIFSDDSPAGSLGQGFNLMTVLDHNQQPRNRKDTFTLKLNCDTGGREIAVFIVRDDYQDDSDWFFLGNYATSGQETIYISLDDENITLGFRYAIRITNKEVQGLLKFSLYELTVEYDPRPEQLTYMRVPNTNVGTQSRKRFTTYAFIIDTLGSNVVFTPLLDNVVGTPSIVQTATKLTYIHYFTEDTICTDIGGVLIADNYFEFYDLNLQEIVSEKLPVSVRYLRLPYTNFGNATKKRVRLVPLIIDTRGEDVYFQPLVDGEPFGLPTLFNTTYKATVYHYFIGDCFGTDFGGSLTGLHPFEFYGYADASSPGIVEVLPVGMKLDQTAVMRFDKIGKLFEIRIRLIQEGNVTSIPFQIYGDESVIIPQYGIVPLYSGTFGVIPNTDQIYTIQLPHNINSSIFRLSLGPTDAPFHRYDVQMRVATSGMESDSKWVTSR